MNLCSIRFIATLAVLCKFVACRVDHESLRMGVGYSNTFAVQLRGGVQAAEKVARKYNFRNHGKIGNLDNIYLFELVPPASNGGNSLQSIKEITSSDTASQPPRVTPEERLKHEAGVGFVEHQQFLLRAKRGYSPPTDPRWNDQWSLLNTGQVGGVPGRDLNVEPAWIQGITGKGVVVAVVDDGLVYSHPDLSQNFDAEGSYDFVGRDRDVMPGFSEGKQDNHGTSCAGAIAMVKDNGVCGVGVAYDSKIAGLRLLSRVTTDATEASALGYKMHHIQIYSNSWGPHDYGFLVEGPGPLLRAVLENGVKKGRNGKGSIYVWAAGNGGHKQDSCATDGYASSIYTIAVGSVDQYGHHAYYDEVCTSKMAVTFNHNTGSVKRKQIMTTTVDDNCRDDFVGTSAACPLVSGTIALALQANPTLTWRDVQYLIAYTSKHTPLALSGQWRQNGAGLWVNQRFGFGAIDVEAIVSRARNWISVPEQHSHSFQPSWSVGNVSQGNPLTVLFSIDENDTDICFLEHIVVKVSISLGGYAKGYRSFDYIRIQNLLGILYEASDLNRLLNHDGPRRGDVSITLTSPQGTQSTLLPYRDRDFVNIEGLSSWPFMSVLHWGEDPLGIWNLTISYRSNRGFVNIENVGVVIYGTTSVPEAIRHIPAQCDAKCKEGCAATGAEFCDACKGLRNATSLECVDRCSGGFEVYKGYCVDPSTNITYTYVQPNIPPIISSSQGIRISTQHTGSHTRQPSLLPQTASTLLPSPLTTSYTTTQIPNPSRVQLGDFKTVSTLQSVLVHKPVISSVSLSPVRHDGEASSSTWNHASRLWTSWTLLSAICIMLCSLIA